MTCSIGCWRPDKTVRCEYRTKDAEGNWRVFEAVTQNLLNNQFVEGIVVDVRDITDRMERERDIARTNEQSEQFGSVGSHDLWNPINIARGHLDLARETGAESSFDEIEHSLDQIKTINDCPETF